MTTQYFCVNHIFEPDKINISDVEVVESFRSDTMLKLGDLIGNRFTIDLKVLEEDGHKILHTYDELNDLGGFPNFFGLQRFGSIRTNTHKIGKLLVQGEYEKAAMLYLFDPQFDREDYRINFSVHNDPVIALKEFPQRLNFERSLLGYLQEHGNLKDSFSSLPRNLSMMFVHAYQSYIFNRILSLRLKLLENINEPQVGDVVLKVDDFFNSDKGNEIVVNRLNLAKIEDMISKDQLRPSIPLVGYETETGRGIGGELENQVMDEEEIYPSMFRIQGHADLSSKGERRIVSCKPVDFRVFDGTKLQFSLGRGIYATSLIREFLKS